VISVITTHRMLILLGFWRTIWLSFSLPWKTPGVDETTDPAETAVVDPDFDVEPTGMDMDTDAWAMDTDVPVDNNAIAIDGLEHQDPTEGAVMVPTAEPTTSPKKAKSPAKKTAPPKTGMAAQNSYARKAPEKYVPK
jgi:hypothetical protein